MKFQEADGTWQEAGSHAICGCCGGLKDLIIPVVDGVSRGSQATIICPVCDKGEAA